jgi:hypothetical protein
MYALWKTQGITIQPWRPDVRFGAVLDDGRLLVHLSADKAWSGKVIFDRARHRLIMGMPVDYPRINQFPEWFTARAGSSYIVTRASGETNPPMSGEVLQSGLPLTLTAGGEATLSVRATQP